jgi:hypothetical protein
MSESLVFLFSRELYAFPPMDSAPTHDLQRVEIVDDSEPASGPKPRHHSIACTHLRYQLA